MSATSPTSAGTRIYQVEKFIPNECPKCRHGFNQEGTDYARLLGDIIDGKKTVRETDGYDIIICNECQNSTARLILESWQVLEKEHAERLLKEGYVNLREGRAFGDAIRDRHQLQLQLPQVSVRGVRAE
jgi:hypothetical protein